MKKTVSLLLALVCAAAVLFSPARAMAAENDAADEGVTPSGIPYSAIGESIDSFMEERAEGIASCVTAVFDRNGVLFTGYYGHSDIENGVKADARTVYEWGSCSKLLVWTNGAAAPSCSCGRR